MKGMQSVSRSRQTGTTVEIWDLRANPVMGDEEGGGRWATVCNEHSGICQHRSLRLARYFAPVPREWCPGCQEEED